MRRPPVFVRLLFLAAVIPAIFISLLASAAGAGLGPRGDSSPAEGDLVLDANSHLFMPVVSNARRKATPTPTPTSPATPTFNSRVNPGPLYRHVLKLAG